MTTPTVVVVGLGPGDGALMTERTRALLGSSVTRRLRTREHPAAVQFNDIASYDELYERADTFDDLYRDIVSDLVALASSDENGTVVYAVPGSPVVAERTVEMLLARDDIDVRLEPAVSVIDVACAALRRDPMTTRLRIVDALDWPDEATGAGPLLVLQTYSPEVMSVVRSKLAPETAVTVLYHLGLDDEVLTSTTASNLGGVPVDHLTSLWIENLDTADVAMGRLVALTRLLREKCIWDSEQTHASLARHLLEEAYEVLDALEVYASDDDRIVDPSHVIEELGDLLFQIVFHAELGFEDGDFDFALVATRLCEKLIERHPHVFADVVVDDSDDAARRWEKLKQEQKGRASVVDGVPLQLPALSLYAKMRRKAVLVGVPLSSGEQLRHAALNGFGALHIDAEAAGDGSVERTNDEQWSDLVSVVCDLARWMGVDLESVVRSRALSLRDEIVEHERTNPSTLPL